MFDVVDDQDRVIGRAPRHEVHARGLKHRAVHVLVFNRRGELFVQKRSATKDTFPLCYDSSASGHLNSGEEYDTGAARELREELGLAIPADLLRKHFKLNACRETGWEFVWVYSLETDREPTIDPEEIVEGAFWPLDEVRRFIADHPQQCAPSFCRVFLEFESRGPWSTGMTESA